MSLAHRTARAAARIPKSATPSLSPFTPHVPTRSTPSSRRSFHLGALGDAVVLTADGISFIHHAGLPWFLTIPLVALGVNISLRLPIQYYTRSLVLRRNALTPLVKAWSARHAATVPVPGSAPAAPSSSTSSPGASARTAPGPQRAQQLWRLRVAGLTERSRKRIYKTWGVQRWKSLAPLLSMLPFVIVTESLRRLCGAPLGWLSRSVGLGSGGHAGEAAAGSLVETSQRYLDPCLADGGCLWFTDLTAMDPYYALPLLCSALLARTSWGRLSREQLGALLTLNPERDGKAKGASLYAPRTPIQRVQTALGRTLLLVPLFPVLFADLPSAIFLYWTTSFALTEVNEALLARVLPKTATAATASNSQRRRPALPYLLGTTNLHKPGHETKAR